MYGPGFNASEGTVRISLANLYTEDYVEIASRLFELLDEYYTEYETEAVPDAA
jgi:aspartate 4-decarboxylase